MKNKISWWEEIGRCRGKNKDGSNCKLDCRQGYRLPSGEIYVPFTCWRHVEQESKLKADKK